MRLGNTPGCDSLIILHSEKAHAFDLGLSFLTDRKRGPELKLEYTQGTSQKHTLGTKPEGSRLHQTTYGNYRVSTVKGITFLAKNKNGR